MVLWLLILAALRYSATYEEGEGGWDGASIADCQAVINGFLGEIYGVTPVGVYPGLYISAQTWSTYLGTSFNPSVSFVLFMAGCACSVGCAPCSSCTTTQSDVESMWPGIAGNSFGYTSPVLWQYWLSGSGCNPQCGDFDVCIQYPGTGTGFAPSISSTLYKAQC